MLILEGADLVGKTTLAKTLRKRISIPHTYSHLSKLPGDWDYPWDYIKRASPFIIQDRFHMSEVMYAGMRGDDTALTPELYRFLEGYLAVLGSYTVVLYATHGLLSSRWRAGEMYTPEQVENVNDLYAHPGAYFRKYHLQYDRKYVLTREQPFLPDSAIDTIVMEYEKRLKTLAEVQACIYLKTAGDLFKKLGI